MILSSIHRSPRILGFALAVTLFLNPLAGRATAEAPNLKLADSIKSLDFVPADVAFYAVNLNMGEQLDTLLSSNAWKKFLKVPSVQMGLMGLNMALHSQAPPAAVYQKYYSEENAQLRKVVSNLFRDESFFYADKNASKLLSLYQELNALRQVMVIQNFKFLANGDFNNPAEFLEQESGELVSTDSLMDRFVVPTFMFGLQSNDQKALGEEFERLDELFEMAFNQGIEVLEDFKKVKIQGNSFWVAEFHGSDLPLEEINITPQQLRIASVPLTLEQIEILLEKVRSSKIVLAIGTYEGNLIFSISPDLSHLENLGKASEKLIETEELQLVSRYANDRLVSLGYINQELVNLLEGNAQTEQLIQMLATALEGDEKGSDLLKQILANKKQATTKATSAARSLKGAVAVTRMTSRGYESFFYLDKDVNYQNIDTSKPLTLFKHLRKDSFVSVGMRTNSDCSPKDYSLMRELVDHVMTNLIPGYIENESSREFYSEKIQPPLLHIAKTLLKEPASGKTDTEVAVNFDFQLMSKAWHTKMPPADQPLPMLEAAILWHTDEVADDMQTVESLWDDALKLVAVVDEENGTEAATFLKSLPSDKKETSYGTQYQIILPESLGLDKQLAPSITMNKSLSCLTLSAEHAERLQTEKPLDLTGPFARLDGPLGSAAVIRFSVLNKAVRPWVDYAADQIVQQQSGRTLKEDFQAQYIVTQIHEVLDIFLTVKASRQVIYRDNAYLIFHSELHLEDLPDEASPEEEDGEL